MVRKMKIPTNKWVRRRYKENGRMTKYWIYKDQYGNITKRKERPKNISYNRNMSLAQSNQISKPTTEIKKEIVEYRGEKKDTKHTIQEIEDDKGWDMKGGLTIPIKGIPAGLQIETSISEDILTGEGVGRGAQRGMESLEKVQVSREARKLSKQQRKGAKKESRLKRLGKYVTFVKEHTKKKKKPENKSPIFATKRYREIERQSKN